MVFHHFYNLKDVDNDNDHVASAYFQINLIVHITQHWPVNFDQ